MVLATGALVGSYRIDRVLGSGGMGRVYLAAHPNLPRHDALKVLSPEFSRDPEFRARFSREADLVARLDHPNIVTVYDRGETSDGQLWIAMQYIAGTDADQETRQHRMPPARAVHIVGEIAKALDYAHRRQLVHRDIKPANFLLAPADGDERVFLADFGIARAGDDSGNLTKSGTVLSTMAYGAPETLTGAPVDHRADIYSLGCSLYRMLTGQSPFAGAPTVGAQVTAHLFQQPPRASDLAPGLPPAIDDAIAKAMAKNPNQRFQSAGEFAVAAVQALQHGPPIVDIFASTQPTTHVALTYPSGQFDTGYLGYIAPPVAPRRRRRWLAVGLTTALLLAGGGFAVLWPTMAHREASSRSAPVDVAALDTGGYQTTPGEPYGAAGKDGEAFESMRLAEFVTGPWQTEKSLSHWPQMLDIDLGPLPLLDTSTPLTDAKTATWRLNYTLSKVDQDVLTANGFIGGFLTARSNGDTALENIYHTFSLSNIVLLFTDDAGATNAAHALADKFRTPTTPITLDGHPETAAVAYLDRGTTYGVSITNHGRYILVQRANVQSDSDPGSEFFHNASRFLSIAIDTVEQRLDKFTPTDPAKLKDLPKDPADGLFARTLNSADRMGAGAAMGIYRPNGRIHFEDNPVETSSWFTAAGVQWVSQLLTAVYQTGGAEQADVLAGKFAGALAADSNIEPAATGVPGFPSAKCFERTSNWSPTTEAVSIQRIKWHYKCIATFDRYMFTSFSQTEQDAKQQISAQYRILAGV